MLLGSPPAPTFAPPTVAPDQTPPGSWAPSAPAARPSQTAAGAIQRGDLGRTGAGPTSPARRPQRLARTPPFPSNSSAQPHRGLQAGEGEAGAGGGAPQQGQQGGRGAGAVAVEQDAAPLQRSARHLNQLRMVCVCVCENRKGAGWAACDRPKACTARVTALHGRHAGGAAPALMPH